MKAEGACHLFFLLTVLLCHHCTNDAAVAAAYHSQTPNLIFSQRRSPINKVSIATFLKATTKSDNSDETTRIGEDNQHNPSPLAGMPINPSLYSSPPSSTSTSTTAATTSNNNIIIRYFYEGGQINQGRICHVHIPNNSNDDDEDKTTSAHQIMKALSDDGVDLNNFYACSYESQYSDGGWMPLESAPRHMNPWKSYHVDGSMPLSEEESSEETGKEEWNEDDKATVTFSMPEDAQSPRRIDIKLFRRPKSSSSSSLLDDGADTIENAASSRQQSSASSPSSSSSIVEHSSDALGLFSASTPGGKIPQQGYFCIAMINPKTCENVGTLWRSAYQLNASILYTIGNRYKTSSTDTLNVPSRIPLIALNDWTDFVETAPTGAVWVTIEMGGTPLSEFVHPRNAIYILGSEDHGVPKSVIRGCREVVSLEDENYGSYNVAVAGSIVMYDRMIKMRNEC